MNNRKYYWVNQGRTWRHEYQGGFLWAPYENKSGRSCWHWDTMDDLKKGDHVFSYVLGKIVGVSKVKGPSYKSQKPKNFTDWNREGRRCDVVYKLIDKPIVISEHINQIRPILPSVRSPLQESGRANQIYLAELNNELGNYFIKFFDQHSLFYDSGQIGEPEDVEQLLPQPDGNYERRTVRVEVTRVIRDTRLSKNIKIQYEYRCQICGITIITNTESGRYAEAAHIRPLEKMGDDRKDNIVCLCPNHHTMLDYGAITINDDYTLKGISGRINTNHKLNKDNLKYHRDHIYNKKLIK